MKLHNSLGRKLQEFQPISNVSVKLYTCGPTVYHYYHIGNLRNAIFYDTLRRALNSAGYKVDHVMNVTDVGHLASDGDEGEDKLEKGAAREGKTVWEVADFYLEAFNNDMSTLNILPASKLVRATKHIDDQVKMVQVLILKDFAYITEQAIYFDVAKLSDYGKLSGQKLSEKEVGARVEVVTDAHKRHPQDFALWFFNVGHFKHHTMHWHSPWGDGFPGWHLECSAIIKATLGDTIDIHAGGIDHIGTHHTNEIAQSEAANGVTLANYWLHNDFLLVDGRKMSKSLGNFYRLQDIIDQGFDPMAFRLLCLQSHYRSELDFSWESLAATQTFLRRIYAWSDLAFQSLNSPKLKNHYQEITMILRQAIANDLDTPRIVAMIAAAIARVDDLLPDSEAIHQLVVELDSLLGLGLSSRTDITTAQKQLLYGRAKAKESRDYQQSDQLRDKLLAQGIGIDDTQYGPRWKRITVVNKEEA